MGIKINLRLLIPICLGILSLVEGQEDYEIMYDDVNANLSLMDKIIAKAKPTRPAPFCFGRGYNPVKDFEDIGALDNDETSDVLKISEKNGEYGPIAKIEYFSIESPNRMKNGIERLNQWMHIVVTAKKPLEGLLIQAISGPLGIPFGIFRTDFECTNPNSNGINVRNDASSVVFCQFRTISSIRHPSFFISRVKGTVFRVHFNWEEVRCSYVPRIQFLVIAIESFADKNFMRFFTPSYERVMDSGDGIPYPYWNASDWEKDMKCADPIPVTDSDGDKAPDKFKLNYHKIRSLYSILFNYEYDMCVDFNSKDNVCPPGPFKCSLKSKNGKELTTIQEITQYNQDVVDLTSFKKACQVPSYCPSRPPPPSPQPPINITNSTPISIIIKNLLGTQGGGPNSTFLKSFTQVKKNSRATHGNLMILGWMMFMGIGTFWARFFKETGGLNSNGTNGCLGMGHWLWGHILMLCIALAIIWAGIMEISHFKNIGSISCDHYKNLSELSKYLSKSKTTKISEESKIMLENKKISQELTELCESRTSIVTTHYFVGCLAVLLFHVSFITGWFRPLNTATRTIIVYIHIFTGYAGKIFAVMSVFVMTGTQTFCSDILLMVILLWVVTIGLFVGGSFVQKFEDGLLKFSKRNFITNEGIEVTSEKTKFGLIKSILLIVSWVLHLIIYIATFFIYTSLFDISSIVSSEDSNLNSTNSMQSGSGIDLISCGVNEFKLPSWKIDAYIYSGIIEMLANA